MNKSELQNIKQRYEIVGDCDALNHALDIALQVSSTDLSVLIEGESGVGKEIIPRIIHDRSPRRREKYFAINCGSIPEGTIDSELFGHEKGSFTGAVGESEGYFGIANKGTLFLDEVGELPMSTQARLLRVLENGEYIRVGGQEVRKTDVRIVAATNVNIQKAIKEGRFRRDLFYRLNTIPIKMPPLRDRGEDIVLLFKLFALQMSDKYHLEHKSLTNDAQQVLMKYKWPGNVRQLKNITEQISLLCPKRQIDVEDLLQFIPLNEESTQLATISTNNSSKSYESEREMLFKILFEMRSNVADLKREVNTLRKRFDEDPSVTIHNGGTTMPIPSGGKMPIEPVHYQEVQPIESLHTMAVQPEYVAEAQEISEPENLNLQDLGKVVLEKALERNGGNRHKAAKDLGVSDRTLYRRLKQYGMQ